MNPENDRISGSLLNTNLQTGADRRKFCGQTMDLRCGLANQCGPRKTTRTRHGPNEFLLIESRFVLLTHGLTADRRNFRAMSLNSYCRLMSWKNLNGPTRPADIPLVWSQSFSPWHESALDPQKFLRSVPGARNLLGTCWSSVRKISFGPPQFTISF